MISKFCNNYEESPNGTVALHQNPINKDLYLPNKFYDSGSGESEQKRSNLSQFGNTPKFEEDGFKIRVNEVK